MNIKTYPNSPYHLKSYALALCTLSFLFLSRIIGQLIQYFYPVAWLPALESWQGSALPYGFLLASQLIILAVMIRVTFQHASGCARRNPNKGEMADDFWGAVFCQHGCSAGHLPGKSLRSSLVSQGHPHIFPLGIGGFCIIDCRIPHELGGQEQYK